MKLMSRILTAILATATVSLGVASAQEFVMKISSPAPLSDIDPLSAWMKAFEQGVEKRSGGRIDVQLYPASQLGSIPSTVEGTAMGTIEMTLPIIGFLSALEPRFQVLDAAGLFDSEEHALNTFSDPEVRAMLSQFGTNAGVEPLFILTSGQSTLVSKNKVKNAGDLSGMKIRTGGATALLNRPMETLGAAPVAMPLGEALPGIQTGTIDGAVINVPVAVGFKFADVAKEATYIPGQFTIIGGLVNKAFLSRLGPDLEKIVREEAEKAKQAYAGKLGSAPKILEGAWVKNGGNINRMSDEAAHAFLAKIVPVVEKIVADNAKMKADYEVLKAAAERAKTM